MARPKEKDSAACNLKLEIGAKERLTELALRYHTSRTKVVEELVNERHRLEMGGAQTDAASKLARKLLSGLDAMQPARAARSRS